MKSSDNNSKGGGKPETNDNESPEATGVEFTEDNDSKNAAGGDPQSSTGETPLHTGAPNDPIENYVSDIDDNIDEENDGDIDDEHTMELRGEPSDKSIVPNTPGNINITGISELDNKLQVERAELEATIALRKYLTACKAVQKDMLKNGDPKKAFMKYHEDVKDIPGAPSLPSCLQQTTDKGCDADEKLLMNPDNYEGIIDNRIKDLENEPNHKPTTEEYTWHNRESANAIAVLQSQGFYDREPYLPSGRLGLKGRMPVFAGRNEVKADNDAWKKIRESNYISGSVPSRLYAATWRGGVHYKVDPETRSVKARYRKNTFSRGTRSQAKSFFQGIVAAGRLGQNPMNVVLNSKNPVIVRDQIKNLAEEAARRGIPLETIKIETPGLKGLKPQTLQEIVLDASKRQSQYDKKRNWGQMISPIRQSHLGRSIGGNTWADKLIKQDQKERTDGTMGKKTVYTSEADVKAISNGSLYLDGDGHRAMRIPEGSAEQPRVEQNRTNSIAWHDKNVKDCEAYLKSAIDKRDKALVELDNCKFHTDPSANSDDAKIEMKARDQLGREWYKAKKEVESFEKKLDEAKQDRADFANIAREDKTKSQADKTKSQADKTTMGMALEAYIKSESKYEDRALDFFDVVTETEKDPTRKFGGTGISEFGIELINDAKVGLKRKLREAADTCRKAKNAYDKTKKSIDTLNNEITELKNGIEKLQQDGGKDEKNLKSFGKELDKKETVVQAKVAELVKQNRVLDKSRLEFADAYNRYHQAEYLSETSSSKEWEGIVKAQLPSDESPLRDDSKLSEYRRGMLDRKKIEPIDNTMQELTDYNFLNRNFFENTYVATQKHAQKANDQYISQANDTPVVNVNDTVGNANSETQDIGIDTPDQDSSATMVPPPHTETSRQKSLDEASSLVDTNLEKAKDAVENAGQEPTPSTTAGKNDQDNANDGIKNN